MGFRGLHPAGMFFDNVVMPEENIIAAAGGFRKLVEAFDQERCGNTTMSRACAQSACDDVQQREQFGKPIPGHRR